MEAPWLWRPCADAQLSHSEILEAVGTIILRSFKVMSPSNISEAVRDRDFGFKGPPIGNSLRGIEWSRD